MMLVRMVMMLVHIVAVYMVVVYMMVALIVKAHMELMKVKLTFKSWKAN